MDERADITGLLRELSQGRHEALDRLMPIVYDELRRIAHGQLRDERPGHTLNTTALVHEAYFKLVDVRRMEWRDRAHFFAMAARLMRRILIDYARARQREKRGHKAVHVPLAEALDVPVAASAEELLALDEALTRLAERDPVRAELVKLRFFAGLTMTEAAQVLGISVATADRYWAFARTWLYAELTDQQGPPGAG